MTERAVRAPSIVVESSAMESWNADAYGDFTLYKGYFSLPIFSWSTTFDVTVGECADLYKSTGSLSATCGGVFADEMLACELLMSDFGSYKKRSSLVG